MFSSCTDVIEQHIQTPPGMVVHSYLYLYLLPKHKTIWVGDELQEEEHLVRYISQKLSVKKSKYSVTEKEYLAIKWAVLTL